MELSSFVMSVLKFLMTSTLVMYMPSDHQVVGGHESSRSYDECELGFGRVKGAAVCVKRKNEIGTLSLSRI